mgnify:CR=1 FL=1
MAAFNATPRADTARATGSSNGDGAHASAEASSLNGENYSFSISTGPSQGTVVFTDDSGSYVYQYEKTLDTIFGEQPGERLFDAVDHLSDPRAPATYVWELADVVNADGSSAGLDHIADFGVGDRLDFSGLVARECALHDAIRVTDTAGGLVVAVDVGGASGFVDIVVLDNVHGLTVEDLTDIGAIAV